MHIYGVIHIKIAEHKTHLNAHSLACSSIPSQSLSLSLLPACCKLLKHKSNRWQRNCNFHFSPNTFTIDYYELILWNLKFQLIF